MEEFNIQIDKIYQLVGTIRENVSKKPRDINDTFKEKEQRNILELRKLHRQLYQNLEIERKKSQLENEKLDNETIFLECLDYQKNSLSSNIKLFRLLKTLYTFIFNDRNFDLIKQKHLNNLASADYLQDRNMILSQLETELQARKQKKIKFEDQVKDKQELSDSYQLLDRQFFHELPVQLKNIQNELSPILDLFQLPQIMLPQQQTFHVDLPKPLSTVYEKFSRYEEDHRNDQYPIKLEIVQNQTKSDSTLYSVSQYEIKVILLEPTIYNDKSTLDQIFEYLGTNHTEFFKDIYPIPILIKYYPMLNRLVVSVDRKNKLSTEDLLCGLIRGDQGEPMFQKAKNDEETNLNNRFMFFQWVQELANQKTSVITAQQIIQLLHQKIVFHLQLKAQLEKLKNSELPRPIPNSRANLGFDGVKLKYFSKIPSSQISEEIPFWFKHFESETLGSIETSQKDLLSQVEVMTFNQNSLLVTDNRLKLYFQENYCLQNQQEHLQEVFKLIVEKDKSTFELNLIIPQRYPFQNVRFQFTKQDSISKKRWFMIQKSLNTEEQIMLKGYEGLLLSFQLQKVIEKLVFELDDGRKVLKLSLKG